MNPILSVVALAYVSQTVGKAVSNLLPWKSPTLHRVIRDWSSTAMGVAMSLAAQIDVLADMGLELNIEPLGYLATGLIVGHGVHYTWSFFSNGPWSKKSSKPS